MSAARRGPSVAASPRGVGIGRVLVSVALALAVLALAAGVSLVVITELMKQSNDRLNLSWESISAGEEIELALLLHQRAIVLAELRGTEDEAGPRVQMANRLRARVQAFERFVTNDAERAIVRDVERKLDAYLAAWEATRSLDQDALADYQQTASALTDAVSRIDDLIAINHAQAAEERQIVDAWSARANIVGISLAVVLALSVAALIIRTRRWLYVPFLRVREAIVSFGKGELDARAPSGGPLELEEIASGFNEAAESLLGQQRARLDFLASLAHDLRNPLTALKTSAALALRSEEGRGPASGILRQLRMIHRQVDRLNLLVGDLLDLSRLETGRAMLQLDECDPCAIAREAVELFEGAAPNHQLELVLPAQVPRLPCDAARIGQILNNLLSNAIKYSPRGGRVELKVEVDNEEAIFSVRDEGIGIEEEELPHLFEAFRRSTRAVESAPGLGLGLWGARRIAEAHGGRISVTSRPDEGSTFRLHLPRNQRPHAQPRPPDAAGPSPRP